MFLRYAFNHLRYHWRTSTIMIVALSLFIASPLMYLSYSKTLEARYIEDALENTSPTDFEIVFRETTQPINERLITSLTDNLGTVFGQIQPTNRTIGVTCGSSIPQRFRCYQIATFPNLEQIIQIESGTLPIATSANGEIVTNSNLTIEAVVMSAAAEISNTELGDRIDLGFQEPSFDFEITGIAQPTNPRDVFWQLQTNVINGILTLVGIDYRTDIVMIVPETDFDTLVIPQFQENVIYSWRILANANNITSSNIQQIADGVSQIEQDFFQSHPDGQIDNSLGNLLTQTIQKAEADQLPAQTIMLALVSLLGVHLLILAYLHKQAQLTEWKRLTQYGTDQQQLTLIYATYSAYIGAVSLILAPIIAVVIFQIFISSGVFLDVDISSPIFVTTSIPILVICTLIGVILIVLGYSIDDVLVINHQIVNTTRSFLTAYYLDAVTFTLGGCLVLRIYLLNTENLSEGLQALIEDPHILVDVIRQQGGLSDPLNLFGPVLIMIGLSIFSLRILAIIRGTSSLAIRSRRGILPQFVLHKLQTPDALPTLMIILILSTGFTALILQHTNNITLQTSAIDQLGGDIRVDYDSVNTNVTEQLSTIDNEMTTIVPILNLSTTNDSPRITMLGVDPELFVPNYSDDTDIVQLLDTEFNALSNGLALPENSESLSMQVNAQTDDNGTGEVQIQLTLMDRLGISETILMQTSDPSVINTFVEYHVELPSTQAPPWRLTDLRLRSVRPTEAVFDEFLQIVFIDEIVAHTSTDEAITIEDFERDRLPEWDIPSLIDRGLVAVRVTTSVYDGEASLRVSYEVNGNENLNPPRNIIAINTVRPQPVPIILSQALADSWASQDNSGDQITPGFQGTRTLPEEFGSIRFNYEVVAIVDHFPTQSANSAFFIVDIDRIRPLLNQSAILRENYYWNQAWIQTNDVATRNAIATLTGETARIQVAEDIYIALREAPLNNIFTTVLYGNFWIALGMICIVIATKTTQDSTTIHTQQTVTLGIKDDQGRIIIVALQAVLYIVSIVIALIISIFFASALLPFIPAIRGTSVLFSVSTILAPVLAMLLSLIILSYILSGKLNQDTIGDNNELRRM